MLQRTLRLESDGEVWPHGAAVPGIDPEPARERYPLGVFQQLIDGLSEQAALIGDDWRILAANDAWIETARRVEVADFMPGANYLRELARLAKQGNAPAVAVSGALEEIRQGKRESFRLVYDGTAQLTGKQFEVCLTTLSVGGRSCLMVTRYDITELAQLRTLRDDFKLSLLRTQEEERRRMGRELHDSGLQLLACLSLALVRLKRVSADRERAAVLTEMDDLLLMARREFRAISYLAHPPQLESLSLLDALQMLVEGLGQRSGLEVAFDLEGSMPVLGTSAEHAVYRVVQEAISNVHRHAGANRLSVRIARRRRSLHVLVRDDGRGIPADVRYGVGLESMQARLREIGGRLTIARDRPGTTVVASLPLPSPEVG
ncbi:MAG TPA: ATP-binding protein [Croceibacterium sp.]